MSIIKYDLCLYDNYMKNFCVGCVAKTSNVTESSVSNTSSHILNTDNLSCKKHRSMKIKKLETSRILPSNVTKESVSNTINYDYQSHQSPDIEERPSKKLKTKEDISSFNQDLHKDQDLHGAIVLFERPGDNVQTILEISAAVSGMALTWNYSKIEQGW